MDPVAAAAKWTGGDDRHHAIAPPRLVVESECVGQDAPGHGIAQTGW